MDDDNLPAEDSTLVERRFRMTVDITFRVRDVSTASMLHRGRSVAPGSSARTIAARQRRLVHQVVADPAVLRRLAFERAMSVVECGLPEAISVAYPNRAPNDEEIIAPVFERLSPADRQFFNEAIQSGLFAENTEDFYFATPVEVESATIREVE